MTLKKTTEKPKPTASQATYAYVGGLDGVLIVVGEDKYEVMRGGTVTLPASDALDRHPDFKRVK